MPLFKLKSYLNSTNIIQKIEDKPDLQQMNQELEYYFKKPVIYSCNCCLERDYNIYIKNTKHDNL